VFRHAQDEVYPAREEGEAHGRGERLAVKRHRAGRGEQARARGRFGLDVEGEGEEEGAADGDVGERDGERACGPAEQRVQDGGAVEAR
jgi:hypothetical protein